jgi:hypothetical protein
MIAYASCCLNVACVFVLNDAQDDEDRERTAGAQLYNDAFHVLVADLRDMIAEFPDNRLQMLFVKCTPTRNMGLAALIAKNSKSLHTVCVEASTAERDYVLDVIKHCNSLRRFGWANPRDVTEANCAQVCLQELERIKESGISNRIEHFVFSGRFEKKDVYTAIGDAVLANGANNWKNLVAFQYAEFSDKIQQSSYADLYRNVSVGTLPKNIMYVHHIRHAKTPHNGTIELMVHDPMRFGKEPTLPAKSTEEEDRRAAQRNRQAISNQFAANRKRVYEQQIEASIALSLQAIKKIKSPALVDHVLSRISATVDQGNTYVELNRDLAAYSPLSPYIPRCSIYASLRVCL